MAQMEFPVIDLQATGSEREERDHSKDIADVLGIQRTRVDLQMAARRMPADIRQHVRNGLPLRGRN